MTGSKRWSKPQTVGRAHPFSARVPSPGGELVASLHLHIGHPTWLNCRSDNRTTSLTLGPIPYYWTQSDEAKTSILREDLGVGFLKLNRHWNATPQVPKTLAA